VTVNDAYADVLRQRLRPRRIVIVRNCVPLAAIQSRPTSALRTAAGIPADAPVLLYHGALAPHRGIEEMAAALLEPALSGAHGVVLGFGGLTDEVAALAREPRFEGRLHLLPAVPPTALVEWVAGADVDVIALQRSTLNHWFCTPNKLWESIAAGVPSVVSDFPEMRRIVLGDGGPLGATCDPTSPASIAEAAASLLDRARAGAFRERCVAAAHERWNWEREADALTALYARIQAAA
jgi:glycosyltransferase involved in cell wall biosynthesis